MVDGAADLRCYKAALAEIVRLTLGSRPKRLGVTLIVSQASTATSTEVC
jgi:hypothetical protein